MREGASGFNLSTAEYEVRGAVGVLMAASEVSYVANFMPAGRILPYLSSVGFLFSDILPSVGKIALGLLSMHKGTVT